MVHPSDPVLAATTGRLRRAGCVAADVEARELVVGAPDPPTLAHWLERRERGEPLAWITGTTRFGAAHLRVAPGVYVPRPQSEELARRAEAALPPGGRAVDLCTGSGAVAAHLQARVPTATVLGIDNDPRAVACARGNGVLAVVGDLADPPVAVGRADVATVVAPYVPTDALPLLPADVRRYEPVAALDGGPDGLVLVRAAIGAARRILRPGGWVFLELGSDQDRAVAPWLAGFAEAHPWYDADGDLRGVAARRA